MLLNLGIIACFILSAGLVYAAVSIMIDFTVPEPLRHRYIRRFIKQIAKYMRACRKKMKQFVRTDSESAAAKVRLKEVHH